MKVVIDVTQEELLEMDMNENELIISVMEAMDNHHDYAGFNVSVVLDGEESFSS